ncbi:hypothetical protein HK20_12825 [Acetobacter sp. DsW_54]|nr:hypothetical protein HK20_12825 [Acetobacter sp. DsW_54]
MQNKSCQLKCKLSSTITIVVYHIYKMATADHIGIFEYRRQYINRLNNKRMNYFCINIFFDINIGM